MTLIRAKHLPYTDGRLGYVHDEMTAADNPPTIRCIAYRDELYALEGSHRLYLCHQQGIVPRIVLLEPDADGCEAFFDPVRDRLPLYDFPYVLVLDLAEFGNANQH